MGIVQNIFDSVIQFSSGSDFDVVCVFIGYEEPKQQVRSNTQLFWKILRLVINHFCEGGDGEYYKPFDAVGTTKAARSAM